MREFCSKSIARSFTGTRASGGTAKTPSSESCVIPSPFPNRTILMKNTRHRLRSAEGIFAQRSLGQFESQPGFRRQGKSPVDHAHRRKTKPLFPNLLLIPGLHKAADLLDEKVGHRGIHMQCSPPADRPFAGMGSHRHI